MVNYQLGKIYKIVGNGLTYYGSTCDRTLSRRLNNHRSNFKMYKAGKYHYVTSFKIIELGNYDIVLVENFPCKCKDELHSRERYYIENFDCINKNIPGQSSQEYREKNQDKIKKYNKLYKELHREKIRIYKNKKLNCLCGGKFTQCHMNEHLRTKKHQQYTMLISFKKFRIRIDNIMNMINNIPMYSRA